MVRECAHIVFMNIKTAAAVVHKAARKRATHKNRTNRVVRYFIFYFFFVVNFGLKRRNKTRNCLKLAKAKLNHVNNTKKAKKCRANTHTSTTKLMIRTKTK